MDAYAFIQTIRTLLIRGGLGLESSLHIPIDMFDRDLWRNISDHPKLPTRFIRDNMDKPWEMVRLSANPNVTFDLIEDFPDAGWNFYYMSANPNITWDFVLANKYEGWDFYRLSGNPAITVDIVNDNPLYPWDMHAFTTNHNVTMDVIRQNPDLDWKLCVFSNGPNATWDDIKDEPTMRTRTWDVCVQKYITPETVVANPQYAWMPNYLAHNPNFNLATLLEMYPHEMNSIIREYKKNPGITVDEIKQLNMQNGEDMILVTPSTHVKWDDIYENMTDIKWEWNCVMLNPTIFDIDIKPFKAALTILNGWRESMSNPAYKLCKQRLMQEFGELENA